MSSRGTDFFISHAGRDTGWAEWLAWQLQQDGYTVELDVWDWVRGGGAQGPVLGVGVAPWPRRTLTCLVWVKPASMPSRETSRPIPLCL